MQQFLFSIIRHRADPGQSFGRNAQIGCNVVMRDTVEKIAVRFGKLLDPCSCGIFLEQAFAVVLLQNEVHQNVVQIFLIPVAAQIMFELAHMKFGDLAIGERFEAGFRLFLQDKAGCRIQHKLPRSRKRFGNAPAFRGDNELTGNPIFDINPGIANRILMKKYFVRPYFIDFAAVDKIRDFFGGNSIIVHVLIHSQSSCVGLVKLSSIPATALGKIRAFACKFYSFSYKFILQYLRNQMLSPSLMPYPLSRL